MSCSENIDLTQSPLQLGRISRTVPDGEHGHLPMGLINNEKNRVRPRRRHHCFSNKTCSKTKSLRVATQCLQESPKFVIKSKTDARFAFLIPIHSLIPVPRGFGFRNDFERHFLASRRLRMSAETSSIGVPRPGLLSASSARRSSSAICSGVRSSSKSPNSAQIRSTSSCCSFGDKRLICSRISVALMVLIYQKPTPQQATSRRKAFTIHASRFTHP